VQATITFTGLEELMAKFTLFQNEASTIAYEAIDANLDAILADAQSLCPVNTGALRASLQKSIEVSGTYVTGNVYTDMFYAAYVEFGTRYTPAQPYLTPAFEMNSSMLVDDIMTLIQERVG